MFNDAFALFSRMETIDVSIAQLISAWSNPKELLLVFDTRLERLIPRATREVEEYSDSADQIENDSVAEESVEDEEEEENPFDPIIAFQEFVKLIDLYALGTVDFEYLTRVIRTDEQLHSSYHQSQNC